MTDPGLHTCSVLSKYEGETIFQVNFLHAIFHLVVKERYLTIPYVKYLPLPNIHLLAHRSSSHMFRYIKIVCASQIASFALDFLHCMFVAC